MAKGVEELLKECIERLNAIDLNAKKIDELPHQTALQTLSKLHVSNQGTSEYLEVQQIVDAVTALTYDRIVSIGTIVLSGNTITIPENAQWVITNVNYSNALPIALNSPFAANGLARKDIVVANKFNSMTLIRGTETAGITIRPNIPIDTVLVTEIDVTDSNIGNILPPNTSTNGIVTTRKFYESADITTSFEAYIDNLPPFTVAVNEIVYFESTDNNDVYLLLVRGGTYGQGQTGLGNRNYLKFKGGSSTQLRKEPFIYTTGAQEFELPEVAAQIVLVTVNGTPVYDYTVLSDTLVRIDLPLIPTVRVVIHYLVDLNLDTAPYYTQAQVDGIASDKVDKVAGKGLSMNDFTDALKTAYDNAVTALTTLLGTGTRLITTGEINKLSNTSGTNTGDQDLSGLQPTLTAGSGISIVGSTISATGGGTSGEYASTDLNLTPTSGITTLTFISASWVRNAGMETIYLYFSMTPTGVTSCAFTLNLINPNGSLPLNTMIGTGAGSTYLNTVPMTADILSSGLARVVLRSKDANEHSGYMIITYKKA